MKTAQEIITLINSYDSAYMMSDSPSTYSKGEKQEKEIHSILTEAPNDTLIEVKSSIDLNNKFLSVPFGKYFEGLTLAAAKLQSKLSMIMSTAWEMFKAELFATFSEALKAAWAKFKLIERMKSGIARFSFIKSNGELRKAIGTLRSGNFQYENKGNKRPGAIHVVKYFDIVSNGWRSCRIDRLIELAA